MTTEDLTDAVEQAWRDQDNAATNEPLWFGEYPSDQRRRFITQYLQHHADETLTCHLVTEIDRLTQERMMA